MSKGSEKMSIEVVGTVTEEEKNQIMIIFERKLGIEELAATLEGNLLSADKNDRMKRKMTTELEKVNVNFQNWWDKMYKKYNWKSIDGCKWGINFETCEIYLDK